jgi:hypothetical protein
MLDPAAPALAWTDLSALVQGVAPSARSYHSLIAAGGILYSFGGWAGFNGIGAVPSRPVSISERRTSACIEHVRIRSTDSDQVCFQWCRARPDSASVSRSAGTAAAYRESAGGALVALSEPPLSRR